MKSLVSGRMRRVWVPALLWGALSSSACAGNKAAPTASKGATTGVAGEGEVAVSEPERHTASGGEQPWGAPVPDAEQEALAMEIVRAIHEGRAEVGVLSKVFIMGPALYSDLLAADQQAERHELETIGTSSMNMVRFGDQVATLEMRSYLDEGARTALLQAPSFRRLAMLLSEGHARPATPLEREHFYALIPFEIPGKAVTIIETERFTTVCFLEDGVITWMDMLSKYRWP